MVSRLQDGKRFEKLSFNEDEFSVIKIFGVDHSLSEYAKHRLEELDKTADRTLLLMSVNRLMIRFKAVNEIH